MTSVVIRKLFTDSYVQKVVDKKIGYMFSMCNKYCTSSLLVVVMYDSLSDYNANYSIMIRKCAYTYA
jgi:hypothetical protein